MINYSRIKRLKDQHQDDITNLKEELSKTKDSLINVSQVLEGTMHEVRRFTGEIAAHSEQLNKILSGVITSPMSTSEIANTIFFTSGMLSARLAFADLELNPASVAIQSRINSIIYKKFEKSRHILAMKARAKNINIKFQGNSFYSQDVLQAFELMPFVLFENAIKYSPPNEEILVIFEDDNLGTLSIKIDSIGPQVSADELKELTQRGMRGKNALKSKIPGDGLGLYLVDFLCKLHNVKLNIDSALNCKYSLGNTEYSMFSVVLRFSIKY